MTVSLNHTIVVARDKLQSASFLTEILGLPPHRMLGHFAVVQVDDTSLDFVETDDEIAQRHFAFGSHQKTAATSMDQATDVRHADEPGSGLCQGYGLMAGRTPRGKFYRSDSSEEQQTLRAPLAAERGSMHAVRRVQLAAGSAKVGELMR